MRIPTLPKLLHLARVIVFSLYLLVSLGSFPLALRGSATHIFNFYMSHCDMNFEVKIYPPQI